MKAGLMLGVNSAFKREDHDFYATDPYVIDRSIDFFNAVGVTQESCIWEPACGQGHLSKRLTELGYTNVYSTDLIDRGYGEQVDFLQSGMHGDVIITNPPFKLASAFVRHAHEIQRDGGFSLFLLKIQFLETEKRISLFRECGLKYIGIMANRICCAMNGEFDKYYKQDAVTGAYKGSTQCYAWFVFQKGYDGSAELRWIK